MRGSSAGAPIWLRALDASRQSTTLVPRIASMSAGTAGPATAPMPPKAWAAPAAVRGSASRRASQSGEIAKRAAGPNLPIAQTAFRRTYLSG